MARLDERRRHPRARVACSRRLATLLLAGAAFTLPMISLADGTPAGTVIDTTARVEFDVNGNRLSVSSNTVSVTVDERIDVVVTSLTPEVTAASAQPALALVFTVANTGNGTETFSLSIDNALTGDDFDPLAAQPAIYFDSDGSGDLTVADQPYVPGNNDPELAADASVTVLVVNDMPDIADGSRGRSQLEVVSLTGSGVPGTAFAGAGDEGVTALVGSSGGRGAEYDEYVIASVSLDVAKSVTVLDPFGGNSPIPGATLTYTVAVQVTDAGTAANSIFTDPIPANTTYVPASLSLNGTSLSDAADADAGQFDPSGAPAVSVALGDLSQASGVQNVSFQVTID